MQYAHCNAGKPRKALTEVLWVTSWYSVLLLEGGFSVYPHISHHLSLRNCPASPEKVKLPNLNHLGEPSCVIQVGP